MRETIILATPETIHQAFTLSPIHVEARFCDLLLPLCHHRFFVGVSFAGTEGEPESG